MTQFLLFFWRYLTKHSTKVWLKGIAAAMISGGAGAMTSALSSNIVAPGVFNLDHGFGPLVKLAAMNALFTGVYGVALYLAKSPLPAETQDLPVPPVG